MIYEYYDYLCTRALKIILKCRGALAQLVEHRTENPGVPGSIPGGTTSKNGLGITSSHFFIPIHEWIYCLFTLIHFNELIFTSLRLHSITFTAI